MTNGEKLALLRVKIKMGLSIKPHMYAVEELERFDTYTIKLWRDGGEHTAHRWFEAYGVPPPTKGWTP